MYSVAVLFTRKRIENITMSSFKISFNLTVFVMQFPKHALDII